jgi:SAM-dependent methyltransferase
MNKFYSSEDHPYRIYSRTIQRFLPQHGVIVDLGCGREASEIKRLDYRMNTLIGLDIEYFDKRIVTDGIYLVNNDINNISIKDYTADIVISRSVLEHVKYPSRVYSEVFRILKTGGYFIFLTPNSKDYSSIIARLIPNRFHPIIVTKTEGRDDNDVFPTYYRCNSYASIKKFADVVGFTILDFEYLGQYPAYLAFNPMVFLLGTIYDKLICKYDLFRQLRGWVLAVLRK